MKPTTKKKLQRVFSGHSIITISKTILYTRDIINGIIRNRKKRQKILNPQRYMTGNDYKLRLGNKSYLRPANWLKERIYLEIQNDKWLLLCVCGWYIYLYAFEGRNEHKTACFKHILKKVSKKSRYIFYLYHY